jgi:hypothetical protein
VGVVEHARVHKVLQRRHTFQNSIARPTAELARMMKLVLLSSRYSKITNCGQQVTLASATKLHVRHETIPYLMA